MSAVAPSYDTQSATITVAEIIPAPSQGRSARLKDSEGIIYGIWPNRLGQVEPGQAYDIEFSSTLKNGVTFRDIKDIALNSKVTVAQANASGTNRAQPARPSAQAAATPGVGQQGGSTPGGSYYRPTPPRDAERMFVVKLAGDFIATGRVEFTPEEMINLVNNLRDAWHATFGQDEQ